MEPDKLALYIVLKDQHTDIANEIYPHYKDLYPGGVNLKGNDCSLSRAF